MQVGLGVAIEPRLTRGHGHLGDPKAGQRRPQAQVGRVLGHGAKERRIPPHSRQPLAIAVLVDQHGPIHVRGRGGRPQSRDHLAGQQWQVARQHGDMPGPGDPQQAEPGRQRRQRAGAGLRLLGERHTLGQERHQFKGADHDAGVGRRHGVEYPDHERYTVHGQPWLGSATQAARGSAGQDHGGHPPRNRVAALARTRPRFAAR